MRECHTMEYEIARKNIVISFGDLVIIKSNGIDFCGEISEVNDHCIRIYPDHLIGVCYEFDIEQIQDITVIEEE